MVWMLWIVWLVLFALLALAWSRRREDGAVRELRRRFARGEIDEAEFRRRLAELRADGEDWLPELPAALLGALLGVVAIGGLLMLLGWGMGWMGHMGRGGWGFRHMMGWGGPTERSVATVEDTMTTVEMVDFVYRPSELTVRPGTTVTWRNLDGVPHSATARDGSWDTGLFDAGEERALTFTEEGEWEYYCLIHPNMVGVLRVVAV